MGMKELKKNLTINLRNTQLFSVFNTNNQLDKIKKEDFCFFGRIYKNPDFITNLLTGDIYNCVENNAIKDKITYEPATIFLHNDTNEKEYITFSNFHFLNELYNLRLSARDDKGNETYFYKIIKAMQNKDPGQQTCKMHDLELALDELYTEIQNKNKVEHHIETEEEIFKQLNELID